MVNEVSTRAAGIVVGYGGRVEKVMGDAILAVFGDPVAREDDAERAVRAALTIHEVVAEVGPRHVGLHGRMLSMHSGINTGVVVTGERDVSGATTGPTGDAVNIAARIQSLAGADEILIGTETVRLVRRHVRSRGPWRARAEGPQRPRSRSPGCSGSPPHRRIATRLRGEFVGRRSGDRCVARRLRTASGTATRRPCWSSLILGSARAGWWRSSGTELEQRVPLPGRTSHRAGAEHPLCAGDRSAVHGADHRRPGLARRRS